MKWLRDVLVLAWEDRKQIAEVELNELRGPEMDVVGINEGNRP